MAAAAPRLVVLLDLNYTFVANSAEQWADKSKRPYRDKIAEETYRTWLLPLFAAARADVQLITVRPAWFEKDTLRRIRGYCDGWLPDGHHFRTDRDATAPAHKRAVLIERIFPAFGAPGDPAVRYLALESNPRTTAMYHGEGVPTARIDRKDDADPWSALPDGYLDPNAAPSSAPPMNYSRPAALTPPAPEPDVLF